MNSYGVFILVISIISLTIVASEDDAEDASRCFHFTWLGPRFNNNSVFLNATCQDATRLASGIPCREPLVVAEDGTRPDVEHIWRNYRQQASCIANNDVCAQYTYYFDGRVENSTYMCTRAIDTQGTAITSGCYEQRNGSFVTKVCLCKPVPGARGIPCNDATITTVTSIFIFLLAVILIIDNNFWSKMI